MASELIRRPVPESSFDIEPSRAEDGDEEEARRDQRSRDQRSPSRPAPKQHYSMLPLLESTPLKARRQGTVEEITVEYGSSRQRH